MYKLFSKGLPAIFTVVAIAALIGFYYLSNAYSVMNAALMLSESETVVLTRGSTIRTLAKQLIDKDLLDDKTAFLIWGRLHRQSTRLQAGEYVIAPESTLADLLENMVAGNVIQHNIAMIEGFTFRQVLASIQQNSVITSELVGLSDDEIMKRHAVSLISNC